MSQTVLRSSMLSATPRSTKTPILTARPAVHNGNWKAGKVLAYRGPNCNNAFGRGSFQMNPNDMAAANNVVADIMDMARKWQAANPNSGFPQTGFPHGGNGNNNFTMQLPLPVDFEEGQDDYTLTADIPGLEKSDLKITVNSKERTLTISGERKRAKAAAEPADSQPKQQSQSRQRYERIMGKFQRTLQRLPEEADLSSVSARVEKGVLTITVKKTEQRRYEDFVEINVD